MALPKDGDLTPEQLSDLVARLGENSMQRMLDIIPFDLIPGGDPSYTGKKKPDDPA